jgi:hypothetical protein
MVQNINLNSLVIAVVGVPIMMSYPHFMNAEPSVTEIFEGLHPDAKRHDFFIDIQPVSVSKGDNKIFFIIKVHGYFKTISQIGSINYNPRTPSTSLANPY